MNKTNFIYILVLMVFAFFFQFGCTNKNNQVSQSVIAVTNSYLQCAVMDIFGDEKDVFSLAPPGMCPGHFDISPSQVNQLSHCKMLLLFDFQNKVETSLAGLKDKGLKTFLIKSQPGMCKPQVYLDTCQEVCNVLSTEFPNQKGIFMERLNNISSRMKKLSDNLQTEIKESGLVSVKVISSGHQSEFAKWLGLDSIASFSGNDSETASNINNCLNKAKQKGIKFIIANKQEGTYLADSLSDRLKAKTIIFSNFPELVEGSTGFDKLLHQNVNAIIQAEQK